MLAHMDIVLTASSVFGGASTLLNGLFFILIFIYPPHHLGNYKSNYYVGALASFLFALTQSLCAFAFISDGSLLLFISMRREGRVILFLFMAAHNSLFMVIAYNFVHRYALISNNRTLLWVHDRKCFLRSLHLLFISIAILPIDFILHADESIRQLVNIKYGSIVSADDFYYALSVERQLFGYDGSANISCFLFVAFGGWNIISMMISGFAIYRFIGRKSKSEKLRQVNQRLLRTLSFQAVSSLLFVYMPGLICATAFITRSDISNTSLYLSSAMSCGTLFNPVVDFILTSEYRHGIMYLLKAGRLKKSSRVEILAHNKISSKISLSSIKIHY